MGKERTQEWWDQWFLGLAKHASTASKDPSTMVGAAVADGKRPVSLGCNGFPQGVADDERLHDRPTKYEIVVHAEVNAILFAGRRLEGCTLYTWPMPPCSRCASVIIQSGIKRVVSPPPGERWTESCGLASVLFGEAGVKQFYCELVA